MSNLRRWLISNPLAVLVFLGFYLNTLLARTGTLHAVGARWAGWLLAVTGVRVGVRGRAPSGGPFVVVSNHQSLLDTPILLANLGIEFRFMAKHSLFGAPIIGAHLRRGGHIAVVREDARGAVESLAAAERVIREERCSVLVFAEGTRSEGELGEFKAGAAHLAIQSGAPILPIALNGSAGLLPRGSVTVHGGDVRLVIGEPIPVAGLGRRDREKLTVKARDSVAQLLASRN